MPRERCFENRALLQIAKSVLKKKVNLEAFPNLEGSKNRVRGAQHTLLAITYVKSHPDPLYLRWGGPEDDPKVENLGNLENQELNHTPTDYCEATNGYCGPTEDKCVANEEPALCMCIAEHYNTTTVLGSALCHQIRKALCLEATEQVLLHPPVLNPTKHRALEPPQKVTQPGGAIGPAVRGGGQPPLS